MKIKSLIGVLGLLVTSVVIVFCAITIYYKHNPCIIIVNNPGAGRFGDQIVGYGKAKYLSYKYNIPFRLIPFEYSECLKMSDETIYTSLGYFLNRVFYKLFCKVVWVHTEQDLIDALKNLDGPTRFIAHINTRLNEHIKATAGLDRYENSWVGSLLYELTIHYPDFGAHLKSMLQPRVPFQRPQLPSDRITVAVHVRKGGGYHADPLILAQQYYQDHTDMVHYEQIYANQDNAHLLDDALNNIPTFDYDLAQRGSADQVYADKFPPEQYYAEQIKKLSKFFNDASLYVYIFTDDTDPVALTKRLQDWVAKPNIIYSCRTSKNSHDTHVLHDWFFMADFNCLIRSGSLFSYTSQLVANYKVIMYPLHLKWIDTSTLLVDKIGVAVTDKELLGKTGIKRAI